MNILLIVLAVALLAAFVVHLARTVDPGRIGSVPFGSAPFGSDREFRQHPDRDDDRITCELSAIRSHSVER